MSDEPVRGRLSACEQVAAGDIEGNAARLWFCLLGSAFAPFVDFSLDKGQLKLELQTPELQTLELQTLELQTPELQTLELQTPELQTPKRRTIFSCACPGTRRPAGRARAGS